MTAAALISAAKTFRAQLDDVLQKMKAHRLAIMAQHQPSHGIGEVIAQHTLSVRDLEGAIMRQGMVLKNIADPDNPNPYPTSKLTPEALAAQLYTAYYKSTDGKSAITGNPIPDWSRLCELCALGDDRMKTVRDGWIAVAMTHPALVHVDPPSGVKL